MRLLSRILGVSSAALCSTAAFGCTVCNSKGGRHLRAGLFDGHFLHTLLLVTAPVPILTAAVLLLHLASPGFISPDPETTNKTPKPQHLLTAASTLEPLA